MKQVSIRQVGEATAADAPQIGDAAGRLGALARAGLPVVPGFWVTAAAYRRHAAQSGVAGALDAAHRPLAGYTRTEGTPAQSADLLDRLRRRIAIAPLPLAVAADLAAAYRTLAAVPADSALDDAAAGGPRVVVTVQPVALHPRAADSLPAGVTVEDGTALADAVRDCWAGLWSNAALHGRADRELPPTGMACAVWVQRALAGPRGRWTPGTPLPADPTWADLTPVQGQALADLVTRLAAAPLPPLIIGWVAAGDTVWISDAQPVPAVPRVRRPRRPQRPRPPPPLPRPRRIALTVLGTLIVTVSRRVRRRARRGGGRGD